MQHFNGSFHTTEADTSKQTYNKFQSLSVTIIEQILSESFSYLSAANVNIYVCYRVSLLRGAFKKFVDRHS